MNRLDISATDAWFIIGLMVGYLMGTLINGAWWGFIFVGIGALLWPLLWQAAGYVASRLRRHSTNN